MTLIHQQMPLWPHFNNVRVTAPAKEPVELNDLREHLRIPAAMREDDRFLSKLITEAREELEDRTGLAFIAQTFNLKLDGWPGSRAEPWWDGTRQGHINEIHGGLPRAFELPRFPLASVDTVTVYDEDSNSTAVTIASVFDIDLTSTPGRMSLQRGAVWPIAQRSINRIEIAYTAGYGADQADVPSPMRRAIRNMAAFLYTHRGAGCAAEQAYMKSGAYETLKGYRRVRL